MIRANVTPAAVLAMMVLGTLPSAAPAAPARVRKLTNIENAYPSFSPDGEQTLFPSNRTGNWEVFVMRANGSDVRQITHHEAAEIVSGIAFRDQYPKR